MNGIYFKHKPEKQHTDKLFSLVFDLTNYGFMVLFNELKKNDLITAINIEIKCTINSIFKSLSNYEMFRYIFSISTYGQ